MVGLGLEPRVAERKVQSSQLSHGGTIEIYQDIYLIINLHFAPKFPISPILGRF